MTNVFFDDRQEVLKITEESKTAIKNAVETVLKSEDLHGNYEVSISFVTNEEIKELNREYRNIDSETDVLSFPMDEEFDGVNILGDIVISTDKIIEQANDYNHSLEREMIYLTVHSMLHLLGYDHTEDDEKNVMRAKEKEIMKKLKIFK